MAALVAAWVAAWWPRSRLAGKFGPERDRTVEAQGGQKTAAAELHERTKRRERFDIRRAVEDTQHLVSAVVDELVAGFRQQLDGILNAGGDALLINCAIGWHWVLRMVANARPGLLARCAFLQLLTLVSYAVPHRTAVRMSTGRRYVSTRPPCCQ